MAVRPRRAAAPLLCLALLLLLTLTRPAPAQTALKPDDLSPPVAAALARLMDQNLSPLDRRAAASALLDMDNSDSGRALEWVLHEGVAPSAWQALAQAIAVHPDDPPEDMAAPMTRLLARADPPVQVALAEALGRYHDRDLAQRLMELAGRAGAPYQARRGPILALGRQRTRDSAAFLLDLTRPDQPEAVQAAAFDALAAMTGLDATGHDRAAWLDWWDHARRGSDERWRQRLMAGLARRDARRRVQQQAIQDRLLESQRALYRTTTPEDRPAVLAYMLGDPLQVIRQLAIDLALQRLVEDLPFGEPLRQALRGRLTDPDPGVRRRSALLLRDLADAPAADRVADRLARGAEQSIPVLRADLLLLTRLPRPQAVEPALKLLNDPAVRGEAAGALAAAHDADLLRGKQARRAADRIHRFLASNPVPAPQVATLLGKVGDDEDWSRIAAWIDSPDPALKRAAASAWAQSSRSLQLLADRVSDPVIEPIIIAAAQRGGDDPWTLRALSHHRPKQPQAAQAWEAALVAMSGRVEPSVVLETVQHLEPRDAAAPLLERMLSAAIAAQPSPADSQVMAPLYLRRAELRRAAENPAGAIADYQQVLAIEDTAQPPFHLSDAARQRLERGLIRAYLQGGRPDEAFGVARRLLGVGAAGGAANTDDPIIERFIEAAHRYADANRRDAAREVLASLRLLLGPAMRPEIAQRIALLEADLARAPTPPPAARADTPEPQSQPQ